MPWYFHYRAPPNVVFDHQLNGLQCRYIIPRTQQRCKRRVVIGLPCCPAHLVAKYNIQIRPSLKQVEKMGVFAYNPTLGAKAIVFRKGDTICYMGGELVDVRVLAHRYGIKNIAPYVEEVNYNLGEDGALYRGIGNLVNHKPERLCNTEIDIDDEINRIVYKAKRNIKNNEELTCDYGDDEDNFEYSTNHSKYKF